MTQNKQNSKAEEQKVDLSPYIQAINVRFKPALDELKATHRFTTAEVKTAIKELNPALNITETQVHDALIEAGYHFSSPRGAAGLRFLWLMVENE